MGLGAHLCRGEEVGWEHQLAQYGVEGQGGGKVPGVVLQVPQLSKQHQRWFNKKRNTINIINLQLISSDIKIDFMEANSQQFEYRHAMPNYCNELTTYAEYVSNYVSVP